MYLGVLSYDFCMQRYTNSVELGFSSVNIYIIMNFGGSIIEETDLKQRVHQFFYVLTCTPLINNLWLTIDVSGHWIHLPTTLDPCVYLSEY
jgi:hypothetical protein